MPGGISKGAAPGRPPGPPLMRMIRLILDNSGNRDRICPGTPPKPGPHLSGYSTEARSASVRVLHRSPVFRDLRLAGRSREHRAAFVVAITVAAVNAWVLLVEVLRRRGWRGLASGCNLCFRFELIAIIICWHWPPAAANDLLHIRKSCFLPAPGRLCTLTSLYVLTPGVATRAAQRVQLASEPNHRSRNRRGYRVRPAQAHSSHVSEPHSRRMGCQWPAVRGECAIGVKDQLAHCRPEPGETRYRAK